MTMTTTRQPLIGEVLAAVSIVGATIAYRRIDH
jgi:hypothetical protein